MSSLHREVMLVLLGDITGGAVAEGERLPPLTELAAQFGVGTGVVRECQRALAERGLVSVRHGREAVMRPEEDRDVFAPPSGHREAASRSYSATVTAAGRRLKAGIVPRSPADAYAAANPDRLRFSSRSLMILSTRP